MSTPGLPSSANVQASVISASLNSGMLFNFLMGIYTMVYTGTMYFYISKKPTNTGRHIVLSAISLLYLLCIGQFIIQWYFLDLAVVANGDTRESIFISTLEGGTTSIYAVDQFLFYSVFVVADGLLIWRCYHVWGMSIRVILVPLMLLLAELGLLVALTAIAASKSSIASEAVAAIDTKITISQIFASLATTVITTCLIGYKIHSASRSDDAMSNRRFTHVLVILIESAAAYSVAILIFAIDSVIPSGGTIGSPLFTADYYLYALVIAVAGMAPTVLVARITFTSANNSVAQTLTHISGLRFHGEQESDQSVTSNVADVFASMHGDLAQHEEEKMIQ